MDNGKGNITTRACLNARRALGLGLIRIGCCGLAEVGEASTVVILFTPVHNDFAKATLPCLAEVKALVLTVIVCEQSTYDAEGGGRDRRSVRVGFKIGRRLLS